MAGAEELFPAAILAFESGQPASKAVLTHGRQQAGPRRDYRAQLAAL
jgi:hypothetical protein